MPSVDSPCIRVCRLEAFVCVGCGRTLDEIRQWTRMTDDERAAVVARVEEEKGHEQAHTGAVGRGARH